MALEDMDLDRINAELEKYGINPDDQKLIEEEAPQIVEEQIDSTVKRKCKYLVKPEILMQK